MLRSKWKISNFSVVLSINTHYSFCSIGGGELFDRVIEDEFVLTEKACIAFMKQILEGIAYMHKEQIIHLDLKVGFIFLLFEIIATNMHIKCYLNRLFTQFYISYSLKISYVCQKVATSLRSSTSDLHVNLNPCESYKYFLVLRNSWHQK